MLKRATVGVRVRLSHPNAFILNVETLAVMYETQYFMTQVKKYDSGYFRNLCLPKSSCELTCIFDELSHFFGSSAVHIIIRKR